jgi:hypothetical protein
LHLRHLSHPFFTLFIPIATHNLQSLLRALDDTNG